MENKTNGVSTLGLIQRETKKALQTMLLGLERLGLIVLLHIFIRNSEPEQQESLKIDVCATVSIIEQKLTACVIYVQDAQETFRKEGKQDKVPKR